MPCWTGVNGKSTASIYCYVNVPTGVTGLAAAGGLADGIVEAVQLPDATWKPSFAGARFLRGMFQAVEILAVEEFEHLSAILVRIIYADIGDELAYASGMWSDVVGVEKFLFTGFSGMSPRLRLSSGDWAKAARKGRNIKIQKSRVKRMGMVSEMVVAWPGLATWDFPRYASRVCCVIGTADKYI